VSYCIAEFVVDLVNYSQILPGQECPFSQKKKYSLLFTKHCPLAKSPQDFVICFLGFFQILILGQNALDGQKDKRGLMNWILPSSTMMLIITIMFMHMDVCDR
jgi:hypothetical protein